MSLKLNSIQTRIHSIFITVLTHPTSSFAVQHNLKMHVQIFCFWLCVVWVDGWGEAKYSMEDPSCHLLASFGVFLENVIGMERTVLLRLAMELKSWSGVDVIDTPHPHFNIKNLMVSRGHPSTLRWILFLHVVTKGVCLAEEVTNETIRKRT